jgi:hypothetical protein
VLHDASEQSTAAKLNAFARAVQGLYFH